MAADTQRIKEITKDKKIKIIEDAAHALGSHYNDGSKVGCCSNSDMTVFSFHPIKAIATGEGGMITTNDINLCNRLKKLRSHGITKERENFLNFSDDQSKSDKNYWYYEMQELGYHYRLTDIQCALGISQLKKIEKFLSKRKKLVSNYDHAFKNLKNCKPIQLKNRSGSSHHLYVLEIDFKKIGKSRNEVMHHLYVNGVSTQVHYIPIPSHPYYRSLGLNPKNYPNSYNYYEKALSIPLFFDLKDEEQKLVIELIKKLVA
jgi:dTDP-4-amino-4,6-dideoxygalactose transaminase